MSAVDLPPSADVDFAGVDFATSLGLDLDLDLFKEDAGVSLAVEGSVEGPFGTVGDGVLDFFEGIPGKRKKQKIVSEYAKWF